MNKTEIVELALKILTELDRDERRTIPVEVLSRELETGDISTLINRLSVAGIVTLGPGREVSLNCPLDNLTALDVLQAVWGKPAERQAIRVLYGASVTFAVPFGLQDSEGSN
jgi:DNA-binding IscR family transcriptional regulator